MKKIVKSYTYKILGLKKYLRLLYRLLAIALDSGFLKNNATFSLHYFTGKIIQEGDHVLDIGANLGYYTRLYMKTVGTKGKVYAVEPVKPFFDTISYFLGNKKNLVLYNYALGIEEKEIQLSVPNQYGYLRTGLPSVYDKTSAQKEENLMLFPAKMVKASTLFKDIERLDYLKMDVEGYERYIIPEMIDFLQKTLSCIQIEIDKDSKEIIERTFLDMCYEAYYYTENKLTKNPVEGYAQDHFFIHPSKKERYQNLII